MVEYLNDKIHEYIRDLPNIYWGLELKTYYLFESIIYKDEIGNYIYSHILNSGRTTYPLRV